MTGGFLSVSIMRPNHCWTVLHVSILAGLLLTLNAESEDSACYLGIRVHRHTAYEALLGADLRINCPITFCNNSQPPVYWYKVEKTFVPVNFNKTHIEKKWKILNDLEGISFLIFKNIQKSDSGLYQCRCGDQVSHAINVSIYDNGELPNDTSKNENVTLLNPIPLDDVLMYVYSSAGIVGFVIIVIIISVISMRGCKGKSKKETQTEQYIAIPMVEQPLSHASLQQSPRESPSVPPSRRSTRKKASHSQPNELTLPRDHVYDSIEENKERQRNVVEEEGSSVVYAALNHQLPSGAPARPWRQMEESSEYAAIRVS